jgi:hypothetical protein
LVAPVAPAATARTTLTSPSLEQIPLPRCLTPAAWDFDLKSHPDRPAVQLAISNIISGARIGFTGDRTTTRHCHNLQSADENPDSITSDLAKESAKGRLAGPFDAPPTNNTLFSPVGAVPKKDIDEYRRIHHLSWPRHSGTSVNESIEDIELRYSSFDDAIRMARRLGKGATFAKLDVKSAFRCIAVHPTDRHLLGIEWAGQFWIDLCLPFGLKSSPAIWERFATLAEWIATNRYGITEIVHYVDDYLVGGRANTKECQVAIDTLCKLFTRLGIPINADKFKAEGTPSPVIKFLGICIDSIHQISFLDTDRMTDIRAALTAWGDRATCTATELQSLIGTLSFASRVVQSGRPFLRRMIDTLKSDRSKRTGTRHRNRKRRIQLTAEFHADLRWWSAFIGDWNGRSLWYDDEWTNSTALQLSTDSNRVGFGAVCGQSWFYGRWTSNQLAAADRVKTVSVPYLELHALVLAAATWGHLWSGKRIMFWCDCLPIVQTLQHSSTRDQHLMSLVRTLHYIAYRHSFTFKCSHLSSRANAIADALSRVQEPADVQRFISSNPTLDRLPTRHLQLPIHNW